MNKKLLKTLQDKCKDFGLTEKAIDEVWLRNPDGTFKLLFKNDKHLP
jgi:hypothetical protein